jgi:hypothetical protein
VSPDRRLVIGIAAAVALLAAAALPARASAARECQGLQVCIPVAGPWVVVPKAATAGRLSRVEYELRCPPSSVVGGTDALVTDPALDVTFLGVLGSPVAPGVTTRPSALFVGSYVGAVRRPSGFRPYIGCVPTAGGGGRATTAYHAQSPGNPLQRRFRDVVLRPGRPQTFRARCGPGERLSGSGYAVAFRSEAAPAIEWMDDVQAVRREVDGGVVVTAARGFAVPRSAHVEVQLQALCARRA